MVGTGSKGKFRDSATEQHAKDHTVVVSRWARNESITHAKWCDGSGGRVDAGRWR